MVLIMHYSLKTKSMTRKNHINFLRIYSENRQIIINLEMIPNMRNINMYYTQMINLEFSGIGYLSCMYIYLSYFI